MRGHTISTEARPGARARTKRTILTLSLAVALFAATASTASTTPTPAGPELTLDVRSSSGEAFPHQKLRFYATSSNDSTLVATGRKIEKTTKQLAAGEETKIAVRLKDKKQLKEQSLPPPPKPKVKVKFAATDEFGQTATYEHKLRILVNGGGGVIVIKELS
jgi:hypothetical protein